MSKYGTLIGRPGAIPVTSAAKPSQVQSSDGAYVFQISPKEAFNRFLILGTSENTYYANALQHTTRAIKNFDELSVEDGDWMIAQAYEMSKSGRIPKNDTALVVFAYMSASDNREYKGFVHDMLPKVARTAND